MEDIIRTRDIQGITASSMRVSCAFLELYIQQGRPGNSFCYFFSPFSLQVFCLIPFSARGYLWGKSTKLLSHIKPYHGRGNQDLVELIFPPDNYLRGFVTIFSDAVCFPLYVLSLQFSFRIETQALSKCLRVKAALLIIQYCFFL